MFHPDMTDTNLRVAPKSRPVEIRPVPSQLRNTSGGKKLSREASGRLSRIRRRHGLAKLLFPIPFILLALLGYAVIQSPIQAALVLESLPAPIVDATAPEVPWSENEVSAPTRPDVPTDPSVQASNPPVLAVRYTMDPPISPLTLTTPQAVLTSLRPVLRPVQGFDTVPSQRIMVSRAKRANVETPTVETAGDTPTVPSDVQAKISAVCDKPRLIATIMTERSGRSPLVEYRFACDDDES